MEDTINYEMNIAINGPAVNHSEKLIKKALDKYFRGQQWNFIKGIKKNLPSQQSWRDNHSELVEIDPGDEGGEEERETCLGDLKP